MSLIGWRNQGDVTVHYKCVCERCFRCFSLSALNAEHEAGPLLCAECASRAPSRRLDPMCVAVWGGCAVAVAVFGVGIVTICRWVF